MIDKDKGGRTGVDFIILTQRLKEKKTFILKMSVIGILIGLIIAFSIPKEYTTAVILMPDSQSSGSSSMSSFASLAGINLGNTTGVDALASPDLYPSIFQSTPFLKGLSELKVKSYKQKIDTTLYTYLSDYQNNPWWSYVMEVPKSLIGFFSSSEGPVDVEENQRAMSSKEIGVLEELKTRIKVSSDKKTSITTIEVVMQSPEISALVADSLTRYFQSYIINYRTQKAREDLSFSEKLYEEAKSDYYKAQQNLAMFIDGNLNVVSAKYRISQERLQNEANSAYSIYNQTAQQLQMAKVKVQNTTPVFTIIQPPIEPVSPTKPAKKIIILTSFFLFALGGSIWVVRKELWELWNNNDTI